MSFYELPAEGKDYFYFHLRDKVETTPHFHSAIELHFVKEGEINVIVDGEKRTLRAGDACFCDSFSVWQQNSTAVFPFRAISRAGSFIRALQGKYAKRGRQVRDLQRRD